MHPARRLLLVIGSAALVLVGAEGAVRILAADLPAIDEWPDATTATKVEQMDALGCADVVFVGNSVARDDFDPATFTEHDPSGRSAYNAALDAAGPRQVARWLPEEVLPRLDPGVVVWALTSPDLNDAAPASRAALESYESSIAGRTDLPGTIQRPLVEHLALVRHRETLTDPTALWTALRDGVDPPGESSLIGTRGQGRSRADLRYAPDDPAVTGFVRDQLLADYSVGGAQADAARDLVTHLRRDGVEVVLVLPPVTDEFIDLHADPTAWDGYRSAVHELAASTGAQLIDRTDAGDDTWFADTHHLNATGARALTADVAREMTNTPSSCSGST